MSSILFKKPLRKFAIRANDSIDAPFLFSGSVGVWGAAIPDADQISVEMYLESDDWSPTRAAWRAGTHRFVFHTQHWTTTIDPFSANFEPAITTVMGYELTPVFGTEVSVMLNPTYAQLDIEGPSGLVSKFTLGRNISPYYTGGGQGHAVFFSTMARTVTSPGALKLPYEVQVIGG